MIARVQFETTLLDTAARETSAESLSIEQLDVCRDMPLRSAVRAPDADSDQFERVLRRDPSVETVHPVEADGDQSLYQVAADPDCSTPDAYQTAVEHGGVLLDGARDTEGLTLELSFPNRDQLRTFREACAAEDISLTVETVHQGGMMAWADQYDVTDPQREVLELAVEKGYFTVPRESSLADLADELDVSSQAVSERLRRGLDSVVAQSVADSG